MLNRPKRAAAFQRAAAILLRRAEIALLGGVTGQVREGCAADLIAVEGRPDEEISVLCKKPALVMAGGEIKRRA